MLRLNGVTGVWTGLSCEADLASPEFEESPSPRFAELPSSAADVMLANASQAAAMMR